jgi:deoxyribodipyrimidine photolyase-related protein
MVPNVLSMSQYADGGIMMNRLYYCSSNYLLKMSNYKKNKDKKIILKSGSYDWTYIIDCLYYRFIYKHKDILSKIYSSAYSVLLLKNKNLNINNKIKIANEYLKKLLE